MNVVNETPFKFAPLMGKVVYPRDTLTLIVKGAFKLLADQPAQPLSGEDQLPLCGDVYYDDDPQSSCRYESDFVHFKPRADVCVVGHCHVPDAVAVPACMVRFSAGAVSKSLMVFGTRRWQKTKVGTRTMSEPEPFSSMELRYENSFGGPDYTHNPIGKGIRSKNNASQHANQEIPNLKVLAGEQLKTMKEGIPAGFGPLGRTWSQRMALSGSYGKKWQKERWPWFPEDFDWSYFNAAPPDQQIKGYLKGDEPLYFENMHPQQRTFNASLPGTRVRCFIAEQCDNKASFREVQTRLDTLWVDMDKGQLVLVWRGLATTSSAQCEQVEDLLIVQEPVHETPRDLIYYERLLMECKADAAAGETEEIQAADTPPEELGARDERDTQAGAGLDAEIEKAMTLAHGHLDKTGLAVGPKTALKAQMDPGQFANQLIREVGVDPAAAATVKAQVLGKNKMLLAHHRPEVEQLSARFGWDPSVMAAYDTLFDEIPEAQEPPLPGGEETATLLQAGQAVGDQDLSGADFSGLSLEGADFKKALLEGADFGRTQLAGADFSGASMANANFEGADLTGAKLRAADLNSCIFSGAVLHGVDLSDAMMASADLREADLTDADLQRAQLNLADLRRCKLAGAFLEQADLTGANLVQCDLQNARLDLSVLDDADLSQADVRKASGKYATLVRCKLTGADFSQAVFEDGNFSGCQCDFANFECARLNRATFEGVRGRRVNLRRACLEQWRAGENVSLIESCFRRACGTGANLAGADLQGSDFILAVMPASDFSRSNLAGCDCRTAELKNAVFDQACLKKARFNRANLFQTRMEQADLRETDFKGCNLYGSEFLNATLDRRTRFSGANLKGTKLEKLST